MRSVFKYGLKLNDFQRKLQLQKKGQKYLFLGLSAERQEASKSKGASQGVDPIVGRISCIKRCVGQAVYLLKFGRMERIKFNPEIHLQNSSPKCPVCLSDADVYKRKVFPLDMYEGWCETCGGNLKITDSALQEAEQQKKRHLLTAWIRRHHHDNAIFPVGRAEALQIINDAPTFDILDKLDKTLAVIGEMTEFPGARSRFKYATDWPLIYALHANEALGYVVMLEELGYLSEARVVPKLSAKGSQRLAEIKQSGKNSTTAFVAMSFATTQDMVWQDAIEPAIWEAGYKPLRVDKHDHVNRIDDEIIGQIKKARFMVADFTLQRLGVYFRYSGEIGSMKAGRPRDETWQPLLCTSLPSTQCMSPKLALMVKVGEKTWLTPMPML